MTGTTFSCLQGSFTTRLSSINSQVAFFAYVVLDYTGAIRQHQRRDRNQHAIAVDSQSKSGRLYCAQLRAGRQDRNNSFQTASSDLSLKFRHVQGFGASLQ